MFFPETSLGLIPSAGGCTRFTAAVGAARSKQVRGSTAAGVCELSFGGNINASA
jgi:enoyl-CoA hydratase/carnithine racemase